MELWQSLLVAFGGNAALLLVLGVLGRSFMSTVLTKDIERFKADLHIVAMEHEVRFSKLHEKRAEVLAELYKLLVAATWETTTFSTPFQFGGEPDKKTQYVNAINAIAGYFRFFDQHRIWLPAELCAPLEAFARKLRSPTIEIGVYLSIPHPNEQTIKEQIEAYRKALDLVEKDIPNLRNAIDAEFRTLLGVVTMKAG